MPSYEQNLPRHVWLAGLINKIVWKDDRLVKSDRENESVFVLFTKQAAIIISYGHTER